MHPRARLLALAIALAAAFTAGRASAYTYGDTLTTIWRPLPNLPALARPGDTFTVWANAPSSVTGWSAALCFGGLTLPLTPAGGGYQSNKGRWELSYQVPPDTQEEIYDLVLTSLATAPDTARHAVKVLPAFKTDYYFAQISDTHLPEHAFSSNGHINTADTTGMADFDAVIADLNVIHPEFIIHTGDLVNEGELEEYLGMYEMGRAIGMLSRLRDPVFVTTGNHDIGGWKPTAPPDGTSRKDWWRYYGWPFLANPPAGDPYHSQDYSFDYGLLHMIEMEAYINNGSYDSYMTSIYGAQSMTPEQMNWLAADVAAVPAGHTKFACFHYDFGGTLGNGSPAANFSQFNNPAALGLDGVIWGHDHVVPEGNRTAHPLNLGIQSVIDYRTFRIFRVSSGVVTPGPMHHAGGSASVPTDSMTVTWNGPNDGTRASLTATVLNRFGESWDHARLVFDMPDHDSTYVASGGTIVETLDLGTTTNVYVDCVLGAGATTVVTVAAGAPNVGVGESPAPGLDFARPGPNPFRPADGALTLRFSLAAAGSARLGVFDLSGREIATLASGPLEAGGHVAHWDGRRATGAAAGSGLYWFRLVTPTGTAQRKVILVR